jgi:hypothetical protein
MLNSPGGEVRNRLMNQIELSNRAPSVSAICMGPTNTQGFTKLGSVD